ncbi:hypothetical protein RRG08_038934 [Elysia crispata]|uniref:Uncharacterized protein n=1 Tax=Elysia crispata TaxID=231223 RepID=A0AAE0Y6X6_9GAST|nr:hypothetical protein RRG08_038934 [Elysia crispata]
MVHEAGHRWEHHHVTPSSPPLPSLHPERYAFYSQIDEHSTRGVLFNSNPFSVWSPEVNDWLLEETAEIVLLVSYGQRGPRRKLSSELETQKW